MQHVNYPHLPGYLYDCPACEAECHCEDGAARCVACADLCYVCQEETIWNDETCTGCGSEWGYGDPYAS